MIKKYHIYKPLTNPWHREEEIHNNHETPGKQTKQRNQPLFPHQDDCKTRINIKYSTAKHTASKTPTQGVTIDNKSTTSEPTR